MDLRIEKLEFSDFRNYRCFALRDLGSLTILIGRNGVGKTNVLEGVNLLTSCESFRNSQITQLVREGCERARLVCSSSDGNRSLETVLSMEPGKKRYQLNGKNKSVADMKGILPSVSFTPDDLELAKKSSAVKRIALDNLGTQLSKSYHVVKSDYEKTIRYKNRLLKEEASRAMIESINDTLVTCGSQLFCYRVSLFMRMIPLVRQNYCEIAQSQEQFDASYMPSWANGQVLEGELSRGEVKESLHAALDQACEEERLRQRSLVGPHADKLTFTLTQRDASQFASQGQQRSIVLAWNLAEVQTIRQSLGTAPVLLLDDVLSELDATRREKLVSFVTDDIQTFITATDLDGFDERLLEKAQVIHL